MNSYLFAIAWRNPPIAAKTQKSGGSDLFKAAASGVTILLLVRWLFSFAVVQRFYTLCSYL